MSRKILTALVWFGFATLGFAGVAAAAGMADPAGDGSGFVELMRPAMDAIQGGQYAYGACLALVVLTARARKWFGPRWPWLRTDEGGAALLMAGSFAGALATTLGAARWPTPLMLWTALTVAVSAAGGYTLIKKLGIPMLERVARNVPGPIAKVVRWAVAVISTGIGTSPTPRE